MRTAGFLPIDNLVAENDALGKSIFELPDDNPVVSAASQVFSKIDEIRKEKLGGRRL